MSDKEIKPNNVVVTDIRMEFESMVVFMVKWAFASIPAIIIVSGLIYAVVFSMNEIRIAWF